MLTRLSIRHIVLIERADLPFDAGLNVMTGETGAGKSILLDALGLVLGARAEAKLVQPGAAEGSVTAVFQPASNSPAYAALHTLGLDSSDELILRRTVTSDGKSRAFINDVPVSVTALKTLGEQLVEIHSQHEQSTLQQPATHLALLDRFGELAAPARMVAEAYATWKSAEEALDALDVLHQQAQAEEAWLRLTAEELGALAPEAEEEEQLLAERARVQHSAKATQGLNAALKALGEPEPITTRLAAATRALARLPDTLPDNAAQETSSISERLDALRGELDDIEQALATLARRAEAASGRSVEALEDRLHALRDAGRKYRVPVHQLAELLATAQQKLATLDRADSARSAAEKTLKEAKAAFLAKAETLSAARQKAARKLEKQLLAELAPLKMERTQFTVAIERKPDSEWSADGVDRVTFTAATNPGSPLAPLHKIASGGELSRFLLALKVVLHRGAGTLVFDEIDTGTGGAVADAIGNRLAALAAAQQVLVVTHLPQVAAKGQAHFHVSKASSARKTTTQVTALNAAEREEELARMLSGATITKEARHAAQKLLEAS